MSTTKVEIPREVAEHLLKRLRAEREMLPHLLHEAIAYSDDETAARAEHDKATAQNAADIAALEEALK